MNYKKEDFAEVLGDINENLVKEAETIKKAKKPVWLKWRIMEACLAVVLNIHKRKLFRLWSSVLGICTHAVDKVDLYYSGDWMVVKIWS